MGTQGSAGAMAAGNEGTMMTTPWGAGIPACRGHRREEVGGGRDQAWPAPPLKPGEPVHDRRRLQVRRRCADLHSVAPANCPPARSALGPPQGMLAFGAGFHLPPPCPRNRPYVRSRARKTHRRGSLVVSRLLARHIDWPRENRWNGRVLKAGSITRN